MNGIATEAVLKLEMYLLRGTAMKHSSIIFCWGLFLLPQRIMCDKIKDCYSVIGGFRGGSFD